MVITVDGKEITLLGKSISFLDEVTGLQRTVIPRSLTFNIETLGLSVQAVARDKSPTGVVVREIQLGNLKLDFEFTEFDSPEFQNKYINGLFMSIMHRFGLAADQIVNEAGEIEIIERPRTGATLPAWVQPTGSHDAYPLGARVQHNAKRWESTVAANVWEPGVSGWAERI